MNGKIRHPWVIIAMTTVAALSAATASRSESANEPQTKSGLQAKHVSVRLGLLVYFLPLRSATFIPTGRELIKHAGGKLILYSPEDTNTLLKLLERPGSSVPGHGIAPVKIDDGQLRLRVEESRGEHLVFVDNQGIVDNAGKTYKLTPDAEEKLSRFIDNLWMRLEKDENSPTRP